MYKLIAFDIDGTILPYGNKELAPEILNMFNDLKKAGFKTAFVTARTFVRIGKMIDTPNIDYFIGANGTFVYDMKMKDNLFEHKVPFSKYKIIKEYCEKNDISFNVSTPNSVYFNDLSISKNNIYWEPYLNSIKKLDNKLIKDQGIHQIAIKTLDESQQEGVIRFIKSIPGVEINTIWSGEIFIGPTGTNKAFGLKKLSELINIKLKEIIAFGDGVNDFEMLKEVGYGIAMETASEELKAIANDTCGKVADFATLSKLKEMKII